MKNKIVFAAGLIAVSAALPTLADSMKVSYSFNKANGYPGSGEDIINGNRGYFPLSGSGQFSSTGRSGLALSNDVMIVGGLAPFIKEMPLTVSFWIKPGAFAGGSTILSKKHTELGQGFSVDFDVDMNPVFSIVDENGGSISVSSLIPLPVDDQWHHISVSYKGDADASNLAMYIDGVSTGLKLLSDDLTSDVATYHPLVVGAGPAYTQAIEADIDEVYIIPQSFTSEQVTCLFQLKTDCAYRPTTGVDGPRGPMGLPGEQGERGLIGLTGSTGLSGLKGEVGEVGPVGAKGPDGPIGFTGPTGLAGADGVDGVDGNDGVNGAPGEQGVVGDKGLTGSRGPRGPQGPTGPEGFLGDRGNQGARGNQGVQGAKGDTGAKGSRGLKGYTGAAGDDGAPGVTGPIGNDGIQGSDGPPGDRGPIGNTGARGNNETGNTGPVGPRGPKGDRGPAPQYCEEIFGVHAPEFAETNSEIFKASIDPEYIFSKAVSKNKNDEYEFDWVVLALQNKEEYGAFLEALEIGEQLTFILDIYAAKGLNNGYVEFALAAKPTGTLLIDGASE